MPTFHREQQRLFYREQGTGSPLLILPGNTASSACHDGELAHFGQRYHTAAMDFRGTGRSDRAAVWPSDWFEVAAHDSSALVAHLGGGPAILVGCSGGAIVALLAAILHPERVRAVIVDSTVERFQADAMEQVLAERSRRTADQVAFWSHAHGPDWEEVVDADTDMLRRYARDHPDHFGGRLPQIACPVLLTASLADPLLPDAGAQMVAMASRIRDCRVFLSRQGGHPLMWSRAEQFRGIADLFLHTIDG